MRIKNILASLVLICPSMSYGEFYDYRYDIIPENTHKFQCKTQFGPRGTPLHCKDYSVCNFQELVKGACVIQYGRGQRKKGDGFEILKGTWDYSILPADTTKFICSLNGKNVGTYHYDYKVILKNSLKGKQEHVKCSPGKIKAWCAYNYSFRAGPWGYMIHPVDSDKFICTLDGKNLGVYHSGDAESVSNSPRGINKFCATAYPEQV